jgi:hypothetical protein
MTPKLTVELVPEGQWGANLRQVLKKKDWDFLRKRKYKAAGHVCEVCSGVGPKWPVECHEIWYYDDTMKVQRLDGLIALCPPCHQVKHIGRSFAVGRGPETLHHMMEVNEWEMPQAEQYIQGVFETWKERSKHNWVLDITWIAQFDISVPEQSQ